MSAVRALLLTDVVDSTQLSAALGDARMAEVWAAHDRAARDLLPGHRGLEIDKTDGFLMLFDSAADAVSYASAYHRAIAALDPPLEARAGLHVGPVSLRENPPDDVARGAKPLEVDGLAKPTAARVMSLARGGQTLLTEAARTDLGASDWTVRSHGHWRVKGVAEPIELFEVGDADSPMEPPPDSGKVYRVVHDGFRWLPVRDVAHTLPRERDPFVGRPRALGALARALESGTRLVSVVGPGGVGKSRVVVHYAWTWLGDWPGGVAFVDLHEARDREAMLGALARGLQVPLGKGDAAAQLGQVLRGRGHCLVVLDTFEHVLEVEAGLVEGWLDQAPEAAFVVTSRAVLGLPGERVIRLEPLEQAEALELFRVRAKAARGDLILERRDLEAAAELVTLLDRLPLAIELAAARVRVLPVAKVLDRMSERFRLLSAGRGRRDRQATLRATLDWSWELLDRSEQSALAQCAIFDGGFTVELAEAVLDVDNPSVWVMDLVQSLVDKSLVRVVGERLELSSSVQEYAQERLEDAESLEATSQRHGEVVRSLAPNCREAELGNLMAACRRAAAAGRLDVALDCLDGAWGVLERTGPFDSALGLARTVFEAATGDAHRGRAAECAGRAAQFAARLDDAERWNTLALEAYEAAGDPAGTGRCWALQGVVQLDRGQWSAAADQLDAALVALSDQPDWQARVRAHLGIARARQGEWDEARFHFELALEASSHDPVDEGVVRANLAGLCFREGDADGARAHLEAGLDLAREAGDLRLEAGLLSNLGALDADGGRLEPARDTLEAALSLFRKLGNRRGVGQVVGKLAYVADQCERSQEAVLRYTQAVSLARELGNRPEEGLVLGNLGRCLLDAGDLDGAAEALGEALAIHREVSNRPFEGHVLGALGQLAIRQGRPVRGRELLQEALEIHREVGSARFEGQTLAVLGRLHLEQGRPGFARMALEIGEGLLRDGGHDPELSTLLRVRADLEASEGNPELAALCRAEAVRRDPRAVVANRP